ncbi:hypothetical protein POM88_026592 [Heracleum sosnowskyi]|uniref:Transposase n=1 Tax=Heracleum sosnowskyi TaxID=360622 RepID=A0AAD8MQ51_9APIA|nr:hypothetical protein POM88_026592 [Heracleum sosnowskyi]
MGVSVLVFLDDREYIAAHNYILFNCPEVAPYTEIFINQLREHNPHITSVEVDRCLESTFAIWFKHYAQDPSLVLNEYIRDISFGPLRSVKYWTKSGLHSPTQSRQRTSKSGQSTPNESRQLTAQSCQHTPEAQSRQLQHTPEAQSRQHTIDAQSERIENTPTPSHPNILNVSSTSANGYVRWDIGLEQGDGRVRLEVIKGTLEPSNACSKRNRLIMYERLEPTGYNWKCVSKETKDFYFEEFKKYFVWKQSDAVIYKGWLANARRKYSEVVSIARGNWENHNRRDNRIGLDVYLSWVEFWRMDDFKKKSSIQKSNRCSGLMAALRHIQVKVQYKRDPTADEIFYLTHTRRVKKKKNLIAEAREIGLDDEDVEGGEDDENFEVVWVDQKSQRIYCLPRKKTVRGNRTEANSEIY